MDEDEARDDIEAQRMLLEADMSAKSMGCAGFCLALMVWCIITISLNTYLQNVTHMGWLGLILVTLVEVLIAFIMYWEAKRWLTRTLND